MSIETLKQALEFVERNTYGGDDVATLITALRTAIEQAEKQKPVAWEIRQGKTDRVLLEITNNPKRAHDWRCSLLEVVPLYTHPAPVQEPVAFNAGVPLLYPEMKDGETISVEYTTPPAAPVQAPVAWMCHPFGDTEVEFSPHQECENCTPLYTTPPAAPVQAPVAQAEQLSKELLGVIADVEEGDGFDDVCLDTIKYVYEQLATGPAAPVHDPVAWGVFEGGNLHDMFFTQKDAEDMAHLKGANAEVRPLCAPPAAPVQDECVVCGDKVRVIPRPWIGLTDDERYDIRASFRGRFLDTSEFAEQVQLATEAALCEKNGGQA